ncbi:hypothetical protein OG921_16170 [Aldersonia sp. NBC_00410]|uniref:zinc-binding dehydrogenase n=1 Tax=Aldersonia sp. NBC_00410 TaxID=2975954 RepID=UPI00225B1878|nr:zinc-binding dehydrogenase [Aldersonia sp. NBC_00410]MCX5044702.1 hypothetical protein [Aldersonia sp. NBC_00410]
MPSAPPKISPDSISGEGWGVVIEATGSLGGFEDGLKAVREAGRFHVFGVSSPDATAEVSPYEIFAKEPTVTGSQSLQSSKTQIAPAPSKRLEGSHGDE